MRVDTFEEQCELGRVWVYQTENLETPIRGFLIAPTLRLATYLAQELIGDDKIEVSVFTRPLTHDQYLSFAKLDDLREELSPEALGELGITNE